MVLDGRLQLSINPDSHRHQNRLKLRITAKPTIPGCYKIKSQSGTDTPHLETVLEKEKFWRIRVKPDGTLRKPLQTLTLRGQKSGKPLQNSG
jgi:hypothetical protein